MTATRRTAGLTLTEVVMAMIIVSLIGAASVNVYRSLADHHAHCRRQSRAGQDARRTMSGLLDRLRTSRMVLADASEDAGDAVALWLDDRNDDGQMQCSELAVLWAQPGEGLILHAIDLPEELEIVDRVVEPDSIDSVSAAMVQLNTYLTRRTQTVLVEDVASCRFEGDTPGETCRLMTVSLVLEQDGVRTHVASATTVRSARINPLPDGWRDQMVDEPDDDDDDEDDEDEDDEDEEDEDEDEGDEDEEDEDEDEGDEDEGDDEDAPEEGSRRWWELFLEWLRERHRGRGRGRLRWLEELFSTRPVSAGSPVGGRCVDA